MTVPPPLAHRERERDVDRFLTFVDAIVAIAITLLVLPLVDLAAEARETPVSTLLSDHQSQIWAFVLSFAVIANLWLTQHHLVEHVVRSTPALLRLMLLWTLTIVVLPFPTALVAENGSGSQALTKLLYVGTMTVSAAVLGLIGVVIGRTPTMRDSDEVPDHAHGFAVVAVFVVSLVLMLALPGLGYWPLALLTLPGFVVDTWRRRTASR